MNSRLFAIGDIHGRLDLLEKLYNKLCDEENLNLCVDKLIFIGDMIDRGPDSRGVLSFIRKLQTETPGSVIALRGNHEDMALKACATRRANDLELWFYNGGLDTVKSYESITWDETNYQPHGILMSHNHLEWLSKLPLSHREEGFFFSHAPVPDDSLRFNAFKGLEHFTDHELTWTYFPLGDEEHAARSFKDNVVGVCGHIHRIRDKIFTPRFYPNYIYTDVGCGCWPYAGLAAVEVKSRKVIQVEPEGWEQRNSL